MMFDTININQLKLPQLLCKGKWSICGDSTRKVF